MTANRLAVSLPGLDLFPSFRASGCFGFGQNMPGTTLAPAFDPLRSSKREPRGPAGNQRHVAGRFLRRMLNAIGLQNPGVDVVLSGRNFPWLNIIQI